MMKNRFRSTMLAALAIPSLMGLGMGAGLAVSGAEPKFGQQSRENATSWVSWDSEEGAQRLARCQDQQKLLRLLRFYDTQSNLNFCGVATAVTALNALGIPKPESELYGPYRMFNQKEFFKGPISKIATESQVRKNGISLELMSRLLRHHGVMVRAEEALNCSREDLKRSMIQALKDPEQMVLVLYARAKLDQDGKGHWAPLAAYDEPSDSFLLLDVAKYKYPPVWVPADNLLDAMQTRDPIGRPRGLLIATKPPSPGS
jgi:hypothetical protein